MSQVVNRLGKGDQTEEPMEQIKVKELASEFELRNSLVITELKKIGVWVPSADTPVDQDIANRIRRRLQLLVEIEQEEQTRVDKAKAKAKAKKKPTPAKARKSIKQLGRPQKTGVKKVEEEPEPESPLASSLTPRKGKATYRRVERPVEAEVEQPAAALVGEGQPAGPLPVSQEVAERLQQPPVEEELGVAEEPAALEAQAQAVEEAAPERPDGSPAEMAPQAAAKPEKLAPKATTLKTTEPRPIGKPLPARPLALRHRARRGAPPRRRIISQPAAAAVKPKKEAKVLLPQDLTLSETLTVKSLSEQIGIKSKDVLKELISMGIMANINQTMDQDLIEKLCERFKVTPTFVTYEEAVFEVSQPKEKPEDLAPRPPVVTVMGHVDHGKTSLLDAVRETQVAAGEAGGITQHIGAYHVDVHGQMVVFLDTPGHEAFTMMRSRGAQATDVVVLVVAADDGVMPQTREAIDHARAAAVPILVAINKIDKPDAQPNRVKQELSELGLIPEEWGGDTVMVEVSATEKTNLALLLEMIVLVSEVLELKANPNRPGMGVVLEAKVDKGRGSVATILIQNGTVRIGDHFVAGAVTGKIRAMFDDRINKVKASGPGSAVEVLGMQGLPQAGDPFQCVLDQAKARQIVDYRRQQVQDLEPGRGSRLSLDELYAKMKAGEVKELPIVLKADAQGSVEVVTSMLTKTASDKVKVRVIHSGVGAISESDVLLASASNAIVIGFNVRPERSAQEVAEREDVDIRLHTVIYDITAEIEKALVGLLEPTFKEVQHGRAEIRDTFKVPKFGVVAGSYVVDGEIRRSSEVRLLRDNIVIHEGRIDSLRRFKEDVNSVRNGYECGISIAGYQDVKPGDIIEAFSHVETAPEL